MDIQREKEPIIMQNYQHMNLVLSTDPKPRLKWTPELHQRFVDAVAHLGGAHSFVLVLVLVLVVEGFDPFTQLFLCVFLLQRLLLRA